MTIEGKKDNVLKLRMDHITLNLLERARSYVDLNKSKFIRQSIREKAQAVIEAQEKTQFTEQDWRMFFDLLDNRPEPTDRMKKAAQKYKDITVSDGI
jgi:uncharacterized protein (DUF1778 family)